MAKSDANRESRVEEELNFVDEVREGVLDLLTEFLSTRATANESRDRLRTSFAERLDPSGMWRAYYGGATAQELRTLLFDLARLHVQSLGDLTRISSRYTDYLRERLRRSSGRSGEPVRDRQTLVRLERRPGGYGKGFTIENGTTGTDTVQFPQVVVFRRADRAEEFSVEARFRPASLSLVPGRPEDAEVLIHEHPWFEHGAHYEAKVTLSMSKGASLSLVIQLSP